MAETAVRHDYSRPQMHTERSIEIREGRHPVVEALAGPERFIPNDTLLDDRERQILLLTVNWLNWNRLQKIHRSSRLSKKRKKKRSLFWKSMKTTSKPRRPRELRTLAL